MYCAALRDTSDSDHVNVDFSIWALYGDDMDLVVTVVPSAESVWPSYLASIPSCLAIGPGSKSITNICDLWCVICSSLAIRSRGSPRLSWWGGSRRWCWLWGARWWTWTSTSVMITMWNANTVSRNCRSCSSHSWSSVESDVLASRCWSSSSWCARSRRSLHPTWSWGCPCRATPLVIHQIQRNNVWSLMP